MNKKQINILILAIIAFAFCVFVNTTGLNSIYSWNTTTTTLIIDARPMLTELIITAIVFGIVFVIFKTPKKRG
jgi:nucleoside recognition membrane protein YjiH